MENMYPLYNLWLHPVAPLVPTLEVSEPARLRLWEREATIKFKQDTKTSCYFKLCRHAVGCVSRTKNGLNDTPADKYHGSC